MQFLNKTLIFFVALSIGTFAKAKVNSIQIQKTIVMKISKLDLHHKGLADALLFENATSSIALKINGSQISEIEIRRRIDRTYVKTRYELQNTKYVLTYAHATANRYYYNEGDCSARNNPLSLLGSLGTEVEATQAINFNKSCNSFPDLKKQISSKISDISSQSQQDAMVTCIFPYDTEAAIKWKNLPQTDTQFGCVDDATKYSGVFDAKLNEIKISNVCLKTKDTFPTVLNEEILHSFGVKDETVAKCLAQCPNKSAVQNCQKIKPPASDYDSKHRHTVQTAANSEGSINQTVSDDYNSAKTIDVPKEIAVAQVPQPSVADLKMSQSVETYTVTDTSSVTSGGSGSESGAVPLSGGGSAGRSYSSSSYPSSMMQFASSAILPEKAFAASGSSNLASGSDAGSSSSSSSGSRWAASTSAAHGAEMARRQAAERSPASDSSLANPNYSASADPAGSGDNTAESKNSSGSTRLQARGYKGSPSSDGTPTSGSAGGSTGFSGVGVAGGGVNENSLKSARAPASAISNASELTRYFQTAPYSEVKQRLQDPQFIQDLKRNSTTVFDSQGRQFGASQGQIIFSDKGNRFVKEK